MNDRLPHEKGFHVSWDQIHRDSRALAWRLDKRGPGPEGAWRGVVAITRGGMAPAMIVARELDMAYIRVLEVATFYTMFMLEPVGKTALIQVCGTTPCMLRGSGELMRVCKEKIGPKDHLSADGRFTWQEVECLGACSNAPMAQINDYYFEDLTAESMAQIIDDSGAAIVFASPKIAAGLAGVIETPVEDVETSSYAARFECVPATPADTDPSALAWLFYTSGTTGRSKGAMLSHRNLMAMTVAHLADFDSPDENSSLLHGAPMSHGSGLYIAPYVLRGARQVVPESAGFDPDEFLDLCSHHPGVSCFLAPTMVGRLIATGRPRPANLQTVVYGGGPMYVDSLKKAMAAFGPVWVAGDRVAGARTAAADGAVDEVLFWMADQGRMGRKSKSGFYDYDEKGKRQGFWAGLADRYPHVEEQPALSDVEHRLMFVQTLEAVRALEEGVLTDIREGDVGAILGWGFAPWSGGPFSWLDMMGAARAVEIADDLTARYGERFAAPQLLRDMAAKGETFYGRFAPAAKAA